jgi:hypothetical protein
MNDIARTPSSHEDPDGDAPRKRQTDMFRLRKPCSNCPFKKGNGRLFQLSAGRITQIADAEAFQCHKTLGERDDDGNADAGEKPRQCAGLMATLRNEGSPNSIMRLGIALGELNMADLDPDKDAFDGVVEAIHEHGAARR